MKPGEILAVTFLDHVEDGKKPLLCTVYGRLVSRDSESIRICSWEDAKKCKPDHNSKTWAIVRSTIQRVQTLQPE